MNKFHLGLFPLAIAASVGIANLTQSGKSTPDFTKSSKPDRAIEVLDGTTLTTNSGQRIKLCGLKQPTDPELRAEAQSKLEALALSGELLVTEVGKGTNGKTIAELFVLQDGGTERHLNSELAAAGLATVDKAESCPNQSSISLAEDQAKSKRVGLWADAAK
jgi:endonuclease YncB( thermonuclease family)